MGQNPRFTMKTTIDSKLRPVPIYDTIQAIISLGRNSSSWDNLLAHHCVQHIVQRNKTDGSYMWYLSHLMSHHPPSPDQARAETVSTKALTHYATLTLHRRIGSRRVVGIRNTVTELSISIARAMFADGAIRLDDIWATISSPLIYWDVDGLPGMCIFYTLFDLIPK